MSYRYLKCRIASISCRRKVRLITSTVLLIFNILIIKKSMFVFKFSFSFFRGVYIFENILHLTEIFADVILEYKLTRWSIKMRKNKKERGKI